MTRWKLYQTALRNGYALIVPSSNTVSPTNRYAVGQSRPRTRCERLNQAREASGTGACARYPGAALSGGRDDAATGGPPGPDGTPDGRGARGDGRRARDAG